MVDIHEGQQLVPSVLDRLMDDDPHNTRESSKSHGQVLREMKVSVRRDLESLLNTRWRCVNWPPNLDELDFSLVNYGIPDFSGANLSVEADREDFRRLLEKIILKFEPRFKTVKVHFVENADRADRVLRFRIDALLYAQPAPEPIIFDSQLEPATGSFEVKSAAR